MHDPSLIRAYVEDQTSAYLHKFVYAKLGVEVPAGGLSLPRYSYAFFRK